MFRPIFCSHMPWRASWEISWSELAVGSLLPASGAGGLALGAWILRQGGMPVEQIARRSVGFFLIKSSVNFAAVALIGGGEGRGPGGAGQTPPLDPPPAAPPGPSVPP